MIVRTVAGAEREYLVLEYAASKRGQPADRLFVPMDQSRHGHQVRGGRSPLGPSARWRGLAEGQGTGTQGGQADRGRADPAVRGPPGEQGLRLLGRHRVAARVRGGLPLRRDARPACIDEVKADMERRPDGPADLRRRRLRQDRDRHPRGVQGGATPASRWRCSCRRRSWPSSTTEASRSGWREFPFKIEALNRFRPTSRGPRGPRAWPRRRGRHPDRHAPDLSRRTCAFKDLGLVVIDEEQRFGVEDKEWLKTLRSTVDVLTLSATPIPRTLHMSLLGIRDISNLETPPQERQRHQTSSGSIPRQADRRGDPPRARIRDGPGLLRPQPGLRHRPGRRPDPATRPGGADRDRPRPDGRGEALEQDDARLHPPQTSTSWWRRRSSRAAWTSPTSTRSSSTRPTSTAWPTCTSSAAGSAGVAAGLRLLHVRAGPAADGDRPRDGWPRSPSTATRLGQQIAMKDLEIRGAGNLLGGEQSGHIAAVGFDLYVRLVGEAVAEYKDEPVARGGGGPGRAADRREYPGRTTCRTSGSAWRPTSGWPTPRRPRRSRRSRPSCWTAMDLFRSRSRRCSRWLGSASSHGRPGSAR